jgi:hypothetical protein
MLFLIISIISLLPIIYNYMQGDRFADARSSLDIYISKISIANFYGDDPSVTDANLVHNSSKSKMVNCITDLVISFIVMVFYFHWSH